MTRKRVPRVCIVGSINIDLVVAVDHLPVPGETVVGGTFLTASGGKGANQSVAAARMGARTSLIGCLGDDTYGRHLRAGLRADGVRLRGVRRVPGPTGVAVILVEHGGQNVIAVAPGANAMLVPSDIEHAHARLARADVVGAQLEIPLPAVVAAATAARAAGVPFMLNAAPARADLDDLLRLVDVLVLNESELGTLTGQTVAQGEEAAAARALLARGPRAVVVTLGARGATVVDARGAADVPSFPVQAIDTTAAGDAFVGALAARFSGLDSLAEAARYAAAAGALACTRAGAQPSLPTAGDVDRLMLSTIEHEHADATGDHAGGDRP